MHRNSARILNSVICVSVLHGHFQIALHSGPFEISCRASTKILAHGHTHATCLDVRVRPSSVSNTAVMHSWKALPGLTHGEEASSIFSDPSGLHTASSHSARQKIITIRSATCPMCKLSHNTVRPPIKVARGLGQYPTRQNTIPRGPLSWPQLNDSTVKIPTKLCRLAYPRYTAKHPT